MSSLYSGSIILLFILLPACEKADPEIPNQEEVITTLIYRLEPKQGGDPVIFSFEDLDGDGGNIPTINQGSMQTMSEYLGTLTLLNRQAIPEVDITEEIREEAESHQFFFTSTIPGLNITYQDADANGFPIGLATEMQTSIPGSGTLTITLRHEPNKSAAGVKDGDISLAGGESDIEITFEIDVR